VSKSEIARQLGIGRTSVRRILAASLVTRGYPTFPVDPSDEELARN
jgi:hypothetical protein